MKTRYVIRRVHLVTGLLCSVIFFILCITGSVFLFREEWEHLADRQRYYVNEVPADKKRLEVDKLVRILEKQNSARVETVFQPANPQRTYRFVLNNGAAGNRRLLYDVDPYTAEIKGEGAEKTASFFRAVKKMHTSLGLPKKIGKWIVFTVTALVIPVLLSGFYLWFPAGGFSWRSLWKHRLSIHWSSGIKRLCFDLHNILGFYVMPVMMLIVVSGLFLTFHHHGKNVASFCPVDILEKIPEKDISERNAHWQEWPLETIMIKHRANDSKSDIMMRIPEDKQKPVRLDSKRNSAFGSSIAHVSFWNGTTSVLVRECRFGDLALAQKMSVLICPFHEGDFLGMLSQIIYMLACMVSASLPVTGFSLLLKRSPS